jgi:hypothetical protein
MRSKRIRRVGKKRKYLATLAGRRPTKCEPDRAQSPCRSGKVTLIADLEALLLQKNELSRESGVLAAIRLTFAF